MALRFLDTKVHFVLKCADPRHTSLHWFPPLCISIALEIKRSSFTSEIWTWIYLWLSFLIWLLFGERADVGRHFTCLCVFLFWHCVRAHTRRHADMQREKNHIIFSRHHSLMLMSFEKDFNKGLICYGYQIFTI